MDGEGRNLADIAALLANEARATMLLQMLDGRAWTPTELASVAGVSRPTTTEHLHRLVQGGVLDEVRQGRHRYVRIGDPAVAEIIESMAAHAGRSRPEVSSLRQARVDRQLTEARTCYHHLAGRLGVALCDAMRSRGHVDQRWQVTDAGHAWVDSLGVRVPVVVDRPLLRPCLDWTERRDHLAGPLADALLVGFRERGWVEDAAVRRAVRLTKAGRAALGDLIDVGRNQPRDAAV